LDDDAAQDVVAGELLMGYRIITEQVQIGAHHQKLYKTNELLMNSKEYSVFKVTKKKRKFRLDTKAMMDDVTGLPMFDFGAVGLKTSEWHNVDVLVCETKSGETFDIPVNTEENLSAFIKAQDCILDTMNKWKGKKDWGSYFDFRNKFRLLGAPLNEEGTSSRILGKTSKDVDYAYALTIHKSQGSTYDNIYMDVQNIRACGEANLALRLLYTGLSRPKNKAYLLL
jgi:hypothetical protein